MLVRGQVPQQRAQRQEQKDRRQQVLEREPRLALQLAQVRELQQPEQRDRRQRVLASGPVLGLPLVLQQELVQERLALPVERKDLRQQELALEQVLQGLELREREPVLAWEYRTSPPGRPPELASALALVPERVLLGLGLLERGLQVQGLVQEQELPEPELALVLVPVLQALARAPVVQGLALPELEPVLVAQGLAFPELEPVLVVQALEPERELLGLEPQALLLQGLALQQRASLELARASVQELLARASGSVPQGHRPLQLPHQFPRQLRSMAVEGSSDANVEQPTNDRPLPCRSV